MVNAGQWNTMRVVKILDFGIYLDGGEDGEILMPTKWVPEGTLVDDMLDVFIYFDSEDRLIATTLTPKAKVGEFAFLKVAEVNQFGAFMEWGLDKDLMVPFKEQNAKMIKGRNYIVYPYIDPRTKRIAASARLEKFLDVEPHEYTAGEQVDLMIWTRSDLGFNAIINSKHTGMLYGNQIFKNVGTGMQMKGYIKLVRPDGKIDLLLEKPGFEKIDELSAYILQVLEVHGGYMDFNDKSPADEIYNVFQMSKKNFKKALGTLYRQKKISIMPEGIKLTE